jgi:translocation and assembly module TamB
VRHALGLLRALLWITGVVCVGAVVYGLFTTSGSILVLREIESRLDLIHVEGFDGRLWGTSTLQHFRYEDAYVRVEVDDATLDWSPLQLLRKRVQVQSLDAARVVVTVKPSSGRTATPSESGDGAITQLPVALDLSQIRVGQVRIEVDAVEPLVFDTVALDGRWVGDQVRLKSLSAVTPWVGALTVDGRATLRPDAVDFESLRTSGFAAASAQGRLGYNTPSDLSVQWTRLHWPPGPPDTAQLSSDHGSLRWQGVFDDWRYTLDAALSTDGLTAQLAAQGSGSLDGIQADRLELDSDRGRIQANARLQWSPSLRLDGDGYLHNFNPQAWVAELPGDLNTQFKLQTTLIDGQPVIEARLDGAPSTLRDYPFSVSGDLRYADAALSLREVVLRSADTRLDAEGQVWPQLALKTRLKSPDLATLWPDLGGNATAELQLRGDPLRPRIDGRVSAAQLSYGDIRIERLRAHGDVDLNAAVRLGIEIDTLDVGRTIERLRLDLDGRVERHTLDLRVRSAEGQAAAVLNGSLDPQTWHWNGTLDALKVVPESLAAWTLEAPAALSLAASAVTLEPACVSSTIARACVGLRPVGNARRLAFRLEHFDLATLDPWLPAATHITGRLDGHGYADIDGNGLHDLRLNLDSSAIELAQKGLPTLKIKPGQAAVEELDGGLRLSALLPLEQGALQLDGRLGAGNALLQRPLRGTLTVDVPELAWVSLLNRELENVSGELHGRFDLGGTLQAPNLAGTLALQDGALRLRSPGIQLERVQTQLAALQGGTLSVSGEAWSDQGQLRLSGQLDPWASPPTLDLNIDGEDFQAVRTPEARVWISPAVKVHLAKNELHVNGSVDVPEAKITPKTLDSGIGPNPDQVIIRADDDALDRKRLKTFADLQLRLGDKVSFDGFGLKTRLGGAVRVLEAPGVPTRALGELRLIGGQYKAYGQDLNLETGRLLFNGGSLTDPAVELRATRSPSEDITVGVLVRGTLDKPEFSLFSTPAMPQERQLSWLVLGRSLDESSSGEDKALVAGAALSLGLAGSEWLAQKFTGRFGIDEFSLGAKPGQSSDQAQLTIGKYLSPKLYIAYGVGLFQPGHTFRLQYDIGHGFKLASETGAESGGDILYTIER